MKIKLTKREAARAAWVSGSMMTGGYDLHVDDEKAPVFGHMDGLSFDNFRAAQCIANAIRAHVMGAKA